MAQNHPFHMVYFSPWPFLVSGVISGGFFLAVNFFLGKNNLNYFLMGALFLVLYFWWRDVVREASYQGFHSSFVFLNLRLGMILFIISEVLFFFSFFWAFFHSSLVYSLTLGSNWPSMGLIPVNPFDVPLLNSAILLTSGVTVTLSHHLLLAKKESLSSLYLFLTFFLGFYFSAVQFFEYSQLDFNLSDSVYGSCFFMATGFHGFHVLVGALFLFVMYFRLNKSIFSFYHHLGMEVSLWYWHFVDVVWLFLFLFMYWWVF